MPAEKMPRKQQQSTNPPLMLRPSALSRTKGTDSVGRGVTRSILESRSYERVLGRLVAELAQAREKERQKIANDLHDQIAQNLVLAKMKLALLETTASRDEAPVFREIHCLLSSVIDQTRSLVCDLYPQVLRHLGLRAALEWLVEKIRLDYGLYCLGDIVSVPQGLPYDVTETIFFAARELLINVAKHARAKQAKLLFRADEQRMLIQIIDDGKGFEAARLSMINPQCGGFGLLGTRERLSAIGATMHIDSTPGHGTKVTLAVPRTLEKRG
jgi:signal transduction histidine kinase